MSMRIFVDDGLKLFVSCSGALCGTGKTRSLRLCRHVGRTHRCIQGAHRLAHLKAGLLILLVQEIPGPGSSRHHNHRDHRRDDEFVLVFYGPVSGSLRRVDSDTAEPILFHLMPGLCAHNFPSIWLSVGLAISESNRRKSAASKAIGGGYLDAS